MAYKEPYFEGPLVLLILVTTMADKKTEQEARRQLPDPSSYHGNYIDIEVPRKNGMYEVVTFAKQDKAGVLFWIALPYAR